MAKLEFWTSGVGIPRVNVRQAQQAEEMGFDGIVYVDSQNLSGDCYIAMALAAKATERIKLGTGVTNAFTRHPAVTASAIATVQAASDGRAHLGIGRGDSALAHLGFAPAPVKVLGDYLRKLQGYLRREEVPFDAAGDVAKLGLAESPESSRIRWLRDSLPKVPVDVAATGPKVIETAAVLADQVMFAVGADKDRISWGIETAKAARRKAGLPESMSFGAYVPVVAHADVELAQRLGGGGVSLFARFSSMYGSVVGPASAEQRAVFERIHDSYDMLHHAQAGSQQASVIPNEFAREFAILGDADHCVARLQELVALGLERLIIVGPSAGADPAAAREAQESFVTDVMPRMLAWAAGR
ncbi:MAG: LLM class flavin-dependent oxidoreductase [Dehalococcoidia bacterium]